MGPSKGQEVGGDGSFQRPSGSVSQKVIQKAFCCRVVAVIPLIWISNLWLYSMLLILANRSKLLLFIIIIIIIIIYLFIYL